MKLCIKCKQREVEQIDDWQSDYCPRCNDRLIDQYNRSREWQHFHPGEPMPESEK